MTKLRGRHYTSAQAQLIRENYGRMPLRELARKLRRRQQSVRAYAIYHGIKSPRVWTEAEIEQLRALYAAHGPVEAARLMGRPLRGVRKIAREQGMTYCHPRWTDDQVDVLVAEFGVTPAAQLAKRLGHSPSAVRAKAHALGLTRLSAEAEELLWQLRDQPGVAEFMAEHFSVKPYVITRSLGRFLGASA